METIRVATSVKAADENTADFIASKLTVENINSELTKTGVPSVTILEDAQTVAVEGKDQGDDSSTDASTTSSAVIVGLVCSVLGFSVLAIVYCLWRKRSKDTVMPDVGNGLEREDSGIGASITFHLTSDITMKEKIQTWVRTSHFQNHDNCTNQPNPGSRVSNAVVTSVQQIKNPHLLKMYKQTKKNMQKELQAHASKVDKLAGKTHQPGSIFPESIELDNDINEFMLFHGTSDEQKAKHIAEFGFDNRIANMEGLYGAGSYFADSSCKSNQYTGSGTTRTFLLCRVLMGWPFCTTKQHNGERKPPDNTSIRGKAFDSIFAETGVGREGNQVHNEFVVFEKHQIYPEYLVKFTVS